MIFDLPRLTLILTEFTNVFSRFSCSCMSFGLFANKTRSSAYNKVWIVLSPILTPKDDSLILLSKSLRKSAKRRGLNRQPCLTPRLSFDCHRKKTSLTNDKIFEGRNTHFFIIYSLLTRIYLTAFPHHLILNHYFLTVLVIRSVELRWNFSSR